MHGAHYIGNPHASSGNEILRTVKAYTKRNRIRNEDIIFEFNIYNLQSK